MELIATCAFGLEKLVYDELKALGLWVVRTEDGRVIFQGEAIDLVRANLWLRCADRVEILIGEFEAKTFDELFDHITKLPWEVYVGAQDAFPIRATSAKSALHSEPAIQSIVKKAIVKRLQKHYATESLPESSGAICQVIVKANKDRFAVAIDSSGDSLHKRGYRTQASFAPLKETLAAAMLKLSDWKPERTLVDLFCGSGTLGIEAALMAQQMAPGLKRPFAFQKWPWISSEAVKKAYEEARQAFHELAKLPIYCFDRDPGVLVTAKANVDRAGLSMLNFKRADFRDLDFSRFENCTFILNPPYGERLEDAASVEALYRDLGKKFSESKNCSLFLLTSNENFPRLFGRTPEKNRKLFNGGIRCYFYSFPGNHSQV